MASIDASSTTTRRLAIAEATPANVEPFGQLVGANVGVPPQPSAYYDGSLNYLFPAFSADSDTTIIVSRPHPRPLRVRWMERHPRHTQTFISLGGKPFVMVLAPPIEADLPDLDQAQALLFDGSAGFMLRRGTWHDYPFAIQSGTDLVIVMCNDTWSSLAAGLEEGEAVGPDLEKRDIQRRLGIALEVSFGVPQTELG